MYKARGSRSSVMSLVFKNNLRVTVVNQQQQQERSLTFIHKCSKKNRKSYNILGNSIKTAKIVKYTNKKKRHYTNACH